MAIETKSDRLASRASLDALFSAARRVRVTAFPDVDVYDMEAEKLAEVRFDTLDLEGEDVLALRELLRIQDPEQPFFCDCEGDIRIELHGEAGLVAVLSAHHGESIDLAVPEGIWRSHAILLDGPALLRWLDGRGVSGPLKRFENSPLCERAATLKVLAGRLEGEMKGVKFVVRESDRDPFDMR